MQENEKIEFALAMNLSNFRKSAKLAVGNVQNMSKNIKSSLASTKADFAGMKTAVLGIGIAATAVAAGGLLLLKKGLTEAISLSNIQEDAEVRLAAVIQATGGAAGYTVGELKNYASELQLLTGVGDEVTLSAQSILATFKEIKGDQFKEATLAALDMAAVMKKDVNGVMIQVGKSLNDPAKGLTALSKAGVTFTEAQKDMVTQLQESGDIIGAQGIILNELKSQFGGAAAALRGTFGGAVGAAGGALADMKEAIGRTITQNGFLVGAFNLVEQKIMSVTQYIDANQESLQELTKKGILSVVSGIGFAVEAIRFFYNGWQGLKLVAQGAVVLIIKGIEKVIQIFRAALFPLDLFLSGLAKIGIIDSNPLKDFQNTMKGFGDFAAGEFTKMLDKVEDTNAKFDSAKDKIAEFKAELASIPVTKVDVAEQTQKTTDRAIEKAKKEVAEAGKEAAKKGKEDLLKTAKTDRDGKEKEAEKKRKEDYGAKSYLNTDKSSSAFELVDGTWQAPKDGPVKNTINNFKAPVDTPADGKMTQVAEKVYRMEWNDGKSFVQGSKDSVEDFVDRFKKEQATAQ